MSGEWEVLITNTAFPIAVTAFLLVRIEQKLNDLNKTLINVLEALYKSKGG